MVDFHEQLMGRALALARRGVGRTAPNPAVGCVIVRAGEIVGSGWHRRAGGPHAEVHALAEAGELARGADLYVTLEPCSHHGRTPPCAEALIAAGVGRVFIGMIDPNPRVAGQGGELLRRAGIPVTVGIRERECRRLNEPFCKHVTSGLPFVILKSALTLDGMSATAGGDSRWVTGEAARRQVHRLRSRLDAVLVGIGTVLADDPQLTVRHVRGRDPLRVVVDSTLRIPLAAQLLNLSSAAKTVVATVCRDRDRVRAIEACGAEVLPCRERDGRVDLADLLAQLGRRGVQSLLLEGGATLAGEALRRGMVDKCCFFYAPKLLAGAGTGLCSGPGVARMVDALVLREMTVRRIGDDILVEGYPEGVCSRD